MNGCVILLKKSKSATLYLFEILEDDVIIDIGGHIGLFALYASLSSPNGKIISIEPHPENFSLLKENMINNNLHKIILVNKAITNSNKNIELFLDSFDDSAHSIYGSAAGVEGLPVRNGVEFAVFLPPGRAAIFRKPDRNAVLFELMGQLFVWSHQSAGDVDYK